MKNLVPAIAMLGLLACLPAIADAPASATAVAPAAATQAAATPAHSCAEIKAFKDQLHKAIDAALKYPHAMSQHPVVGVTNISYEYYDGKVHNVRITMYSGDETLDRTALAAVKEADYASIPSPIDDEPIQDLVIIIFDNTGESDHAPMKKKARDKQDAAEACAH